MCKAELAIARTHPLLGHQMVLPDCEALPPVGSRESRDCVKLGFPVGEKLVQPHSCYKDTGAEYRGTASTTRYWLAMIIIGIWFVLVFGSYMYWFYVELYLGHEAHFLIHFF